jgi:type II secretory pathway component GspD/PulD (secretin)
MKKGRWFLFLALSGSLLVNHNRMLGAAQQQLPSSSPQDGVSFDKAPLEQFIGIMIHRLRIDVVIIHNVSLNRPISIHKDAPVSDQELFDLFLTGLRNCHAALVKKGGIYQIIPLSQDSNKDWEPVIATPQTTRFPPSGTKIMINVDGADLSDVLSGFLETLNLIPIVINPYVSGRVTILCSTGIQKTQVQELVMALLQNNKATLIESNGKYEIIPASKPIPAGWTELTQPPPLKPGITKPRRSLYQQEWESHILTKVDPKLSLPAGQPKLTGKVRVEILLNESGNLDLLRACGLGYGHRELLPLAEAAIEAVRQWKFAPFIRADGQPERVIGSITVIFSDTGVEYDYNLR